jgi:hypothetical protein
MTFEEQGPGSHHQRALGSGQGSTERLDGAPIGFGRRPVVQEVVDKSGVNHAIRHRRSTAQAFEILELTAMRVRASGDERRGGRIRASEAHHLMVLMKQVVNNGRTDETCGPSNKYFHDWLLCITLSKQKISGRNALPSEHFGRPR